jgi:hypothetical protein
MQSLASLLISLAVMIAAAGIGRVLRGLWSRDANAGAERLVVDTAMGMGALSLVMFALSTLQLGHIQVRGLIVGAFLAPSLISAVRGEYGMLEWGRGQRTAWGVVSGVLLVVLALAALVPALAPPSMSDWDSLSYHLAVPKLYLEHGGFYYIEGISHSNFPFLMEMLYMVPLEFGDAVAAKLIGYWTAVLLVLAAVVMARRHFELRAAPMAALGIAGMPIVLWLATTAYVDTAAALYTLLCVHMLMNYFDSRERGHLVGCAVAAGFAASTKMTGLALIPVALVWLVADWLYSRSGGNSVPAPNRASEHNAASKRAHNQPEWTRWLMFVGVALAVCAPWYVKSIVYTGSPVYPFFYSIFGGLNWNAELASHYATQQSKFGMGHGLHSFLMLPYNLTFHSEAFYDTAGLFVGPIMLAAVPVLFVAKYRCRKLAGLLGFFVALVVIWFGLTHQSRYLVPALATLAVLAAAVVYHDDRLRWVRRALAAVFAVTAAFGLFTLWPGIQSAWPVAIGRESRHDYLMRALDIYPAQRYMNKRLPRDARVALFGDNRGFYLDRRFVWADFGHNLEFARRFDSAAEFVGYLKSRGVTHAMVNFTFYPKRGKDDNVLYAAVDSGLFEQIYPDGDETTGVAVYKIR